MLKLGARLEVKLITFGTETFKTQTLFVLWMLNIEESDSLSDKKKAKKGESAVFSLVNSKSTGDLLES